MWPSSGTSKLKLVRADGLPNRRYGFYGVLFWPSTANRCDVSRKPARHSCCRGLGCSEQCARLVVRASTGPHAAQHSDAHFHWAFYASGSVAVVPDCTAHHHTQDRPPLAEHRVHSADCMYSARLGLARALGRPVASCESTFLDCHAGGHRMAKSLAAVPNTLYSG